MVGHWFCIDNRSSIDMSSSSFTCIHFIRELRKELGGVVSAGIDLCNAIAEMGHRVILVTCDATDAPESPAARAKGTVRPSAMPRTMSRTCSALG